MMSAWNHYASVERPLKKPADAEQAASPARPNHFSVQRGDILHLDGNAYVVMGMVSLGMPTRELTLHLQPADG